MGLVATTVKRGKLQGRYQSLKKKKEERKTWVPLEREKKEKSRSLEQAAEGKQTWSGTGELGPKASSIGHYCCTL